MKIKFDYSPNFSSKTRHRKDIKFVIIHYTGNLIKPEKLVVEKLANGIIELNSITFPVIIIDDLKNIKMVNSAAEAFFKSSLKVLAEKKIQDIFPFSSPALFLVDSCIKTGSIYKEYKVDLSTPMSGIHKDIQIINKLSKNHEIVPTYLITDFNI